MWMRAFFRVDMYSALIGTIFLNLHFILFFLVGFMRCISLYCSCVCTHGRSEKGERRERGWRRQEKGQLDSDSSLCGDKKTVFGSVSGPALLLNDFQGAPPDPESFHLMCAGATFMASEENPKTLFNCFIWLFNFMMSTSRISHECAFALSSHSSLQDYYL